MPFLTLVRNGSVVAEGGDCGEGGACLMGGDGNGITLSDGVYQLEVASQGGPGEYQVLVYDPTEVTNEPPIANAGVDVTITLPQNSVQLSGSGADAETLPGDLNFLWSSISAGVVFQDVSSPTTTVTLPQVAGEYILTLQVEDAGGLFDTDSITVYVDAAVSTPAPTLIPPSWGYRKHIAIDHTNVGQSLTNFPLLVTFNNDADIGANTKSDGTDIRFKDVNGTDLAYERESFNIVNGQANGTFWVKVPQISSVSDTSIYLHYGDAEATDGQQAATVWDTNYKGVWHFGDGATLTTTDSTSNSNHGIPSSDPPAAVAGKISGAASFDVKGNPSWGTGNYIQSINNIGITGNASRTLEVWAKTSATDGSVTDPGGLIGWGSSYGNYVLSYLTASTASSFKYSFWGFFPDVQSTQSSKDDTWHHVVATHDGSTVKMYIDGLPSGSDFTGSLSTYDGVVYIGTEARLNTAAITILDEARISSVARSPQWIKFGYMNVNEADHEVSWGTAESL